MTMPLQEYPTSTVHDLCQIADKPVYLKKDVDELISRYDETISYYQEYVSYYQKLVVVSSISILWQLRRFYLILV